MIGPKLSVSPKPCTPQKDLYFKICYFFFSEPLDHYLSHFDEAAAQILDHLDDKDFHPMIAGILSSNKINSQILILQKTISVLRQSQIVCQVAVSASILIWLILTKLGLPVCLGRDFNQFIQNDL